jgi:hypothetical protein
MSRHRPNPLVLEALDMLKARGLVPVVRNGGKHFKVGWFDRGRRFLLIVPRTPGDRRSALNSRAMLRRLLRADGPPKIGGGL